MLSRDNGKLCFEMLEMNSASQNHLPCRGLENASEVGVFIITNRKKLFGVTFIIPIQMYLVKHV